MFNCRKSSKLDLSPLFVADRKVLILLWVMGVGFDITYTISGKWNVSMIISRPYEWVYKTLSLSPLVVEHGTVAMGVSSQQIDPRLNLMDSQFLIPVLWNLCSESVGGIKFWGQVEDSETGSPSSITIKMESHICFSILILLTLTLYGRGRQSIVLLILVLWGGVNHWWMRGGGWHRQSYLGQLKLHLFPARTLSEAISMKHSDMLHWLDISLFYFHEPLLFQIFVHWKFMKT